MAQALTRSRSLGYALGDVALNTGLVALALIYAQFFLVQVAGIRPLYAGLIPLIGRLVDAVSDPLMGWLSDRTRTRFGRRRPYFLLGALPFGVLFALLWSPAPFESDAGVFAYYAVIYALFSLSMTIPSVPYLAVLPEMAEGYDQRTLLNTYRAVGSIVGCMCALGLQALADALGGGSRGFANAGWITGLLLIPCWGVVFFATFERFSDRPSTAPLVSSTLSTLRRTSFKRLLGMYLCGRIAMDLAATLLKLFYLYWLLRNDLFTPIMALFFTFVAIGIVVWRQLAESHDKAKVYVWGCLWWIVTGLTLPFFQPDWPTWSFVLITPVVAFGYAVVDLMPWSMIGEVIDEDELESGERREGIYNGVFTFIRKLGGALGVALALGVLDFFGYAQVEDGVMQSESARQAIRWMMGVGPALFLALGLFFARGYPLTRAAHDDVVRRLGAKTPPSASL